MSQKEPDLTDWPEIIAALADGELTETERAVIEARVAGNPAAQEMLAAQRDLSPRNRGLWRTVRPELPSDATWDAVWDKIEDRLANPVSPEPAVAAAPAEPTSSRWSQFYGFVAAVSVAAAAILVALWMASSGDRVPSSSPNRPIAKSPESGEQTDPIEFLEVADAGDVEILSVADEDLNLLLVGVLTLPEEMDWAVAADVELDGVEPDTDGSVPNMGSPSPGGPMMVDFRSEISAPEGASEPVP